MSKVSYWNATASVDLGLLDFKLIHPTTQDCGRISMPTNGHEYKVLKCSGDNSELPYLKN